MILSAQKLDAFDSCERKFAYLQRYEPRMISPLRMLYASLEAAIVDPDPEEAAKAECMKIASKKELILTDINKFMSIRHTGYLAGIIAVALRERMGILHRVPNGFLADMEWESGLFETESGIRHRIELVSHFDDDRLRAVAHSWRVVGELAALGEGLTLTAVVIGAHRGGRRHSEWTRGLQHPQNKVLRFARRNKSRVGFDDTWVKVWREHQTEISTEKWLASMKQDDVLDPLIMSREIPFVDDHRMVQARRDMEIATYAFDAATERSPMRRSSCDDWGGCQFGHVCWSPKAASPSDFPELYSILVDTPRAKPEEDRPILDTFASPHPVPVSPAELGHLGA